MIEQQLAEFFRADDAIRDRVAVRIYPGRAPQGVQGEVIILTEITSTPTYTIDLEAGVHEKIVQVDCYAATAKAAYELSELIRTRLSGYRGDIGTTTPAYAESCRIISSGQETEQPSDASDRWIHRRRFDFALFVQASVPSF